MTRLRLAFLLAGFFFVGKMLLGQPAGMAVLVVVAFLVFAYVLERLEAA